MAFIIVQRSGLPQCEIRKLQDQDHHFLVLITKNEVVEKLKKEQSDCFDIILAVDHFTEEEVIKECVRALEITGISNPNLVRIASTNETNTYLLGKVREFIGTPQLYFKDISRFKDKLVMKEKMIEHHIPIPRYISFQPKAYQENPIAYVQTVVDYLKFPVFAKPIDEAGSLGACKLIDQQSLEQWCSEHVESENYELDEYISGTLYHCDSIIHNGEAIFTQYCRYSCPNAEYLNGRPLGSYILNTSDTDYCALEIFNKKVLEALSIVPDGAIHMEVFKDQLGNLIFLEIACRPPGGCVPEMTEKVFGFNFHEAHFKAQMGVDHFLPERVNRSIHAGWMCFPRRQGTVIKMNELSIKSSCKFDWLVKPGDVTKSAEHFLNKAGEGYFWNENPEILVEDFWYLFNEYVPIIYEN